MRVIGCDGDVGGMKSMSDWDEGGAILVTRKATNEGGGYKQW